MSGPCTLDTPCDLLSVVMRATGAANVPIVRLLPGIYATQLSVMTPTSEPVRVVASGATLAASTSVFVGAAGNVDIRDAALATAFSCGTASGTESTLTFRNTNYTYRAGERSTLKNCKLDIERGDFDFGTGGGGEWLLQGGATVTIDRSHLHVKNASNGGGGFFTLFDNSRLRMTNSILEDVFLSYDANGVLLDLAFNTIVLTTSNSPYVCHNGDPANHIWTATYEDNIIVSPNAGLALISDSASYCAVRHNILFPQPTPIADNIIADPQFVDMIGRDFHLRSTSPAKDAAVPSAPLTSDHDFDGVSRPQGAQPDIGALEFKP